MDQLLQQHEKVTYLVGAGISINPPSNVPAAGKIISTLLKMVVPKSEQEIIAKFPNLRYELLIEKIQNRFDKDLRILSFFEQLLTPNLIHYFLAQGNLNQDYIITPNFDYLLEIALQKLVGNNIQSQIVPVITESDYNAFNQVVEKSNIYPIFKIHGSRLNFITQEETKDTIITTLNSLGRNREGQFGLGIEFYKKKVLESLLADRTIIVMGYSASDHFDIIPMLQSLPNIKKILWIDHTSQEKFQICKLEDFLRENSHKQHDNLFTFLRGINQNCKEGIFLISGKTTQIIDSFLWPKLYSLDKLKETDNLIQNNLTKETFNFDTFASSILTNISPIDQYLFSCNLYELFSDYENLIKCGQFGLELALQNNNYKKAVYFHNYLGLGWNAKGDSKKAEQNYLKSKEIIEKNIQDKELLGMLPAIINNLAKLYERSNNIDQALSNYNLSINLSIKLNDMPGAIGGLINKAGILVQKGDFDEALQIYEKVLQKEDMIGDLSIKALIYSNMSRIFKSRNQMGNALKYLNESIKIDNLIGNKTRTVSSMNEIAVILLQQNQGDAALQKFYESFQLANQLNLKKEKATIGLNIAMIFLQMKEYDKAFTLCLDCRNIFHEMNDTSGTTLCDSKLGEIHFYNRRFPEARQSFQRSLEGFRKLNNQFEIAHDLFYLGQIDQKEAKFDDALSKYDESKLILQRYQDHLKLGILLRNIGEVYQLKQDYKSANQPFTESIEYFKKANLPDEANKTEKTKQMNESLIK